MELSIAAAQSFFFDNPYVVYSFIIVISVIILRALRGFNCWYWKINERIALQQETNELLKELINQKIEEESPKTIVEDDYARLFMMEN